VAAMIELHEIFNIEYGNQLDLNKMKISSAGINFISRSRKNNGLSAIVEPLDNVQPYAAGGITVTMGGTYLLSAFIQPKPFYTAQNIKVLTPKVEMSLLQKAFYCTAIPFNRFRYTSHGREANATFNSLLVPSLDEIPEWVNEIDVSQFDRAITPLLSSKPPEFDIQCWQYFRYQDLFEIRKGKRLTKSEMLEGETPFIGAIEYNNGYRQYVDQQAIHEGNTLTVNYNGSVAEAFYQPVDFWASDDVNVLYPKFRMNKFIGLFLAAVIKLEKYRFNYGRKWHAQRMNSSIIKLPTTSSGKPDWEFMETYIKSLPYSSSV
jgi:hypothetical protein